ncbi:MAG: SDR family oxidoreductase, partial [Limnohabitans sp.]
KFRDEFEAQGAADEVAHVALWLASEEASYVHGAVIDVAGGR